MFVNLNGVFAHAYSRFRLGVVGLLSSATNRLNPQPTSLSGHRRAALTGPFGLDCFEASI